MQTSLLKTEVIFQTKEKRATRGCKMRNFVQGESVATGQKGQASESKKLSSITYGPLEKTKKRS